MECKQINNRTYKSIKGKTLEFKECSCHCITEICYKYVPRGVVNFLLLLLLWVDYSGQSSQKRVRERDIGVSRHLGKIIIRWDAKSQQFPCKMPQYSRKPKGIFRKMWPSAHQVFTHLETPGHYWRIRVIFLHPWYNGSGICH